MDDLGNIIYLIFLALSLLAGVWKNMRKRKEKAPKQASSAPVPSRPAQSIDDFDEMIERQKRKEAASEKRLAEMEAKAKEALKARGRLRPERSKRKMTEPIENKEPDLNNDLDLREFDARKAIIYSEILNPPYL